MRVDSVDGPVTQRAAMLSALSALTSRQRAVIVLRFFCDLSVEQAAVELNCTAGTVKSQTSKALQAMRTAMTGEEAEVHRG
ncbi:sigma factor-like helix-turn-helix DNA-binding protein [Actinoplanes italicus]|uniref:sigma factor-like helix-turn-helix DNA-binding protein n=1 Tax=Actinoplanes italicus TaxID=113567 RepID=UPI001EF1E63C|nr:sigma factor-like helix-turn-helix DNA-binding protein [Actinoplanes italicus]